MIILFWFIIDILIIILETIYLFIPFTKSFSFRESSNIKQIFYILIFPLAMLVFNLCNMNPSVKLFILVCIGIITSYLLFQTTLWICILYSTLWAFIIMISESITMGLLMLINKQSNMDTFLHLNEMRIQCMILSKFFNYIIVMISSKYTQASKLKNITQETKILVLQLITGILCIFTITEFTYYNMINYKYSFIILSTISILILITFIILYQCMDNYFISKQKEFKDDLYKAYLNKSIEYYKKIESSQIQVQKLYHDIKNHLLAIQGLTNNVETSNYVIQCLDQVKGMESFFKTGNNLVDIILSDKKNKAEELGIETNFLVEFQSLNKIELYDLTVLLGNTIDNALEACRERMIHMQNAYIELKSICRNNTIIIVISNNYWTSPVINNNTIKSTKKGILHGIGYKNISDTLAKYNGHYLLQLKDDKFILTIIMDKLNYKLNPNY